MNKTNHKDNLNYFQISSMLTTLLAGPWMDEFVEVIVKFDRVEVVEFSRGKGATLVRVGLSLYSDGFRMVFISASNDRSIKVFDLETKQEIYRFENAHADKFTG